MSQKARSSPAERGQEQRKLQKLFTPIRVGRLELKNRIIMPPMIERLATEGFRARALMLHFRVRAVCTTDDPTDDLSQHRALAEAGQRGEFAVKVLPAFRADKAMAVESPEAFNRWLDRLELAAGEPVRDYRGLIEALQARHRFFHEMGCRLSDHGIEEPYAEDYTERELAASFRRLRSGRPLDRAQALRFKSGLLYQLAVMDGERGWTQQFHFGALRNNSRRMHEALGPDTGFDSIGDFPIGGPLVRLLDRLHREGRLARTILYSINPRDNEMLASIAGSFQDGSVRGKMQLGSAWWFNDQLDGMRRQLEALSSIGLLSTFVGMLTDSRSFLSYPRHEYFRRVLCNLLGNDVENGELPDDTELIGSMVKDICFRNAVAYFGIEVDNDAHGCLQDVHWSAGLIAYFPSYSLGNLYSAQFFAKAKADMPGLMKQFECGEFGGLLQWLRTNIHKHGQRYRPAELCKKVTGQPLSHKPLIDYMTAKYSEIYGF